MSKSLRRASAAPSPRPTRAGSSTAADAPGNDLSPLRYVVVGGVHVRVDRHGRFNLNDLHVASGGARRHQPSNWLRNAQTKELIAAAACASDSRIKPFAAGRGRNGGTFAMRTLAVAYAAWIDAHFHLSVLQTYEAVASGVHTAGMTLQERMLLAERREGDSAAAASIGSMLMHDRRRVKPGLKAELARLKIESQRLLFVEERVYVMAPGQPAANEGQERPVRRPRGAKKRA